MDLGCARSGAGPQGSGQRGLGAKQRRGVTARILGGGRGWFWPVGPGGQRGEACLRAERQRERADAAGRETGLGSRLWAGRGASGMRSGPRLGCTRGMGSCLSLDGFRGFGLGCFGCGFVFYFSLSISFLF